MKKLDLNSISEEVLDECFGNDEVETRSAIEMAPSTGEKQNIKVSYNISLKRPKGLTNEMIMDEIKNGINVTKNTELLVRYNYGMIVDVASKCTCYIPFEDKISYGVEGFMRAIKSYDPSKNIKFITYATTSVYMTVYNESSDANYLVHFPRYMSVHNINVKRFSDNYQKEHGRRPSAEEISESTGIEIQHVKNCLLFKQDYAALDSKLSHDSESTLSEIITGTSPDYMLNDESIVTPLKYVIGDLVNELNPKECEIISRIHGLGDYEQESLRDVADNGFYDDKGLQVKSRSSVHRKYTEAMTKLKRIVKQRGYEFEDF